jgi:hypothetical protein
MPFLYRQVTAAPVASAAVPADEPDVAIEPEPTAEERAAILAALAAAGAGGRNHGPGPWWEAGLRDEEEQA